MQRNQKQVSASGIFIVYLVLLNVVVMKQGFVAHSDWYTLLFVTLPLLLVSIITFKQKPS